MSGDLTIHRLENLGSAALTYAEVKAIPLQLFYACMARSHTHARSPEVVGLLGFEPRTKRL
jgi:hypothetical protein